MQDELSTTQEDQTAPIDAVITWVDGASEAHLAARLEYMAVTPSPLHENAINPHRWACNDEITYCLQSIDNHASWIRKIWIVVDTETPDLDGLSEAIKAKVEFVFHTDIFGGFASVLPTFNSLTIESMLWRIDGLAERFLYFNDDVFLTARLDPEDVFDGSAPVLRGKWVNYADALQGEDTRNDPAKFNHFMQLNAASLAGFDATRLFSSAHVVHPLRRSVMAQLFEQHKEAFVDNIGHRFRDLSQFLPQALHNHACIATDGARLRTCVEHLHIKSGQGVGHPASETEALLDSVFAPEIKFLCVNDLPQLEQVVPEARVWLERAIGGFRTPTP
ncbi:Stealth CR1 domain-containing protein [Shimia thalassica]|uniref:Stealth CR1 domain-containing protein n=1 Tax=Shimia thalassica TaxID=1715693 RepID=UPI0026E12702|nr:Stealth CR1 domain-containing protein [Shimia thalassica]MDO6481362.1 Stealth CR1 domain-containing protein [Shimia thalassica]